MVRLWHDVWIKVVFLPCYSRTKLQLSSARQKHDVWTGPKKYGYSLDCLHYLFHCLIMSLLIYAISVELNATKWICNKKSNLFHCKVPGITSYILRNVVPQGKLSSLALKLQARLHKNVTYFTKQDLPAFFFFFFRFLLYWLSSILLLLLFLFLMMKW